MWISILAILVIGWIDYVTGRDIGCTLFYLFPIAFAGWHRGIRAAVAAGIFASAAWLTADLLSRPDDMTIAISLWNAFTRLVIYVSEGVFVAVLRRDRERLRELIAREAALARTDPVTSLANSRAFMESLERELAHGQPASLLYFDLDNFKLVNDRRGHRAGDAVLTDIADALRGLTRAGDVVARIGGDEFAVLLHEDAPAAQFTGEQIVRRVREIGVAHGEPLLGATVGVSTSRNGMTAEELLHEADAAMYEAKAREKGTVVVARQNA